MITRLFKNEQTFVSTEADKAWMMFSNILLKTNNNSRNGFTHFFIENKEIRPIEDLLKIKETEPQLFTEMFENFYRHIILVNVEEVANSCLSSIKMVHVNIFANDAYSDTEIFYEITVSPLICTNLFLKVNQKDFDYINLGYVSGCYNQELEITPDYAFQKLFKNNRNKDYENILRRIIFDLDINKFSIWSEL